MREGTDTRHQRLIILAASAILLVASIVLWRYQTYASRQFDPLHYMAKAERAYVVDGQFYRAAAIQKGPLWLAVYYLAYLLGGQTYAWHWIAVFLQITSLASATAIVLQCRLLFPARRTTPLFCLGVAVHLYLMCNGQEFASALYSRNLSVALTAVGFTCLWWGLSRGGPAAWPFLLGGLAIGQAVQLMPTEATSALLGLGLIWVGLTPASSGTGTCGPCAGGGAGARGLLLKSTAIFAVAGTLSFSSSFIYCWATGNLSEMWLFWFTYNSVYAKAMGLGAWSKATKFAGDLAGYLWAHPEILLALLFGLAAAVQTFRSGGRLQRLWAAFLCLWLLSECISVGAADRFFEHYLVLIVVPICALTVHGILSLLDHAIPNVKAQTAFCAALALAVLILPGQGAIRTGLLYLHPTKSEKAIAYGHEADSIPELLAPRGVVDVILEPHDFFYFWTMNAGHVAYFRRPIATRFAVSFYLIGVVPGARPKRSNRFIPPGVWERWSKDMAETRPKVILVNRDEPVPQGAPLARLLSERYTLAVQHPVYELHVERSALTTFLQGLSDLRFSELKLPPPCEQTPDAMRTSPERGPRGSAKPRSLLFPPVTGFVLKTKVELGSQAGDAPKLIVANRDRDGATIEFEFAPNGDVVTRRDSYDEQREVYFTSLRSESAPEDLGILDITLVVRHGSALLLGGGRILGASIIGEGAFSLALSHTGAERLETLWVHLSPTTR